MNDCKHMVTPMHLTYSPEKDESGQKVDMKTYRGMIR